MSSLNFTPAKKNTQFSVANIRAHEFDVREEAAKNDSAVNELVMQGEIKRLPLVTLDGVVIDGRTAYEALLILKGSKDSRGVNIPPTTVLVDVVNFSWDSLSKSQQREVITFALGRNIPNTGYIRAATNGDIIRVAIQLIESKSSVSETVELLKSAGVSPARSKEIAKHADNVVLQRQLACVRSYSAEHDVKPSQAVKDLGYPVRVLESFQKTPKSERDPHSRISCFSYVRTNQPELDKALKAVQRYNDGNLTKFIEGNPKFTGKLISDIADYHVRTAHKILDRAQKAADHIRTEVNKRVSANHRF